jgi:hypothetical protein
MSPTGSRQGGQDGQDMQHAQGEENAYGILVEKPEGERRLGRHRHRWEDNIKMYLGEIEWGGMD